MGQNVQLSLRVSASAPAVFATLTASDQLEIWLADEVDVSLEEHRYDFWGRYVPENPDRDAGRHPLLSIVPDRSLSFGWRLREIDTTVTITITPDSDESELVLLHANVPPRAFNDYSVADYWALTLENLRSWIERGVIGGRCDYASPQYDGVTVQVDIDAASEVVFSTLIDPAKLERYIANNATVEPRVGGRYDFGWGDGGPVKIVELIPNERLAYEWKYDGEPDTLVTWTLEGSGGRTRLTLRHSGFGDDGYQEGYRTGWQHFVNYVKSLAEVGDRWSPPTLSNPDHEYVEAGAV
jgi:uncharacterized protein YndB with AHSA1/START domain